LINAFMVATKVVLVLVTSAIYQAPHGVDVDKHPSIRAVQWLAISTSMSYVVGAIVGHVVLTRRFGRLGFSRVARTVAQIGVASLAGAAAAWGATLLAHDALGTARAGSGVALVGGSLAGLVVLVGVAWRMRIADVAEVLASARR
jgi:putative peptidoglycan lipid II flippase